MFNMVKCRTLIECFAVHSKYWIEIVISDEQIKFNAIRWNELNSTAIIVIYANKTNLRWEYIVVKHKFGMISKMQNVRSVQWQIWMTKG